MNASCPRAGQRKSKGLGWRSLLAGPLVCAAALGNPPPEERKERPPVKAMLIQPAELESRLKDPALRLLDTRAEDVYAKEHIPGAVRVDVAAWQALGKTPGGLRDAKAWGEKVSELGIGPDTRVVVYGSRLPDSGRIWWLLGYVGVADARILDGGWDLWKKEGRPVESSIPRVLPARFEPKLAGERLAEKDQLEGVLKGGKVKVLDTRSKDEFTGKEVRGKRGGHIQGAVNLDWEELVGEDGRFKTPEQLRQLFKERGVLPGDTAVCYCQSGGRAAVEVLALELAGYPNVKLYVRGWEEWSADPKAPAGTE